MNSKKVKIKTILTFGTIAIIVGSTILPIVNPLDTDHSKIERANEKSLMANQINDKNQVANGTTLYVGGSGPGNYTNIQDAIDDASNGDTVFVYNGIYYENVVVDRSINLIGEDKNTTIIDGCGAEDVMWIYSSSVMVSEFTIENSSKDIWRWSFGIWVRGEEFIKNIHISNCIVKNNLGGIRLGNVYDSCITNCYIRDNFGASIDTILSSHNIKIKHCTINNNGAEEYDHWLLPGGIHIRGLESLCRNIIITDCEVYNNWYCGINIERSKDVEVHHNNVHGNRGTGICVSGAYYGPSFDINIHDNDISKNKRYKSYPEYGGIYLEDCSNVAIIQRNDIYSNSYGVVIHCSSNNIIRENNITRDGDGILFEGSSNNNTLYRNIISSSSCGVYLSGTQFGSSSYNTFSQNIIYNNSYGIHSTSCSNNKIENCIIRDNPSNIYLCWSQNDKIENCAIFDGSYGIRLQDSSNDIILNCTISNNEYGIYLAISNKNSIHHNKFINNANQAWDNGNNNWDDGKEGNYWDDYHGIDLNGDGIGDIPYHIDGDESCDRHPLMNPINSIINEPRRGYLYIANREIPIPFRNTIIIGEMTVNIAENDFVKVDFYIDDELKNTDLEPPFQWEWNEKAFWKHTLKVVAYEDDGNITSDGIKVMIFNV
jgi:parallel beta-helix repeat protein